MRARGKLVPRSEATRNDQLPTGAVELAVESLELLSSSEVLPFQLDDENVDEGLRIRHRYLDLRRPENAGSAGHSHARGALDPALPGRARLPRPRDAHDDARDARGRARLRDPVPARARDVLRAAAEPAALQAAADVRRLRPLLPDRALLAGRGAARRPRARVHAARPRDELRRAGGRAHADRAADGRGLARRRPRDRAAVPARAVRRGARALRLRQARPALRPRDRRRQRAGARTPSSACSRAPSRPAASCAA